MAKPKLVDFSEPLKSALEAVLIGYQPDLFSQIGGTIALVDNNTTLEQFRALGDPSQLPLLVLSMLSQETLEKTLRERAVGLRAVLAHPRTFFWRLPCPKEELLLNLAATELKTAPDEGCEALWQELLGACFGHEARLILHSLQGVGEASDPRFAELQARACAIGVEAAAPAELREKLASFRHEPPAVQPASSQKIEVAVDVDGTLIWHGGRLNAAAVAFIEREKSAGRRVIVWTGGLESDAKLRLAALGFVTEVVNKGDFKGTVVDLAVDDNPDSLRDEKITAVKVVRPQEFPGAED